MVLNVNVRDFGAKGDGVNDDRAAIQSAIDYVSANGGGTVNISAGTYCVTPQYLGDTKPIGCVYLKNNVSVVGDGIGVTTLKLMDGATADISGIVRTMWSGNTTNMSLSKLSIDGNRDNVLSHKAIGFLCGVKPDNNGFAANITVDGVEIKNCVSYGFDPHEITDNMVIKNSIAHNNGLDGFVADYLTHSNFSNNVAWDNDRHGFNITTSTPGLTLQNNIAFENKSAGLVFQRGDFNIDWPYNSTVQGGAYFDNAKEGILVRLTDKTEIHGTDVFDNGNHGVRFRAATNSVLDTSVVRNNSQNAAGVYDDVALSQEIDPITGNTYGANNNKVAYNAVFSDGTVHSRWNVREQADASDYNLVKGNVAYGGITGLAKTSGLHSQTIKFSSSDPLNGGVYKAGTSGADIITDKSTNDTVLGFDGNDSITGSGGNDVLAGGTGDDTVLGGSSNDRVYGEEGNDSLRGDAGNDSVYGDSGNDYIDGGAGNDSLFGGDGNDTILGGTDNDTILGLGGDDNINGGDGNDSIFSGDGSNTVFGGKGDDIIFGGEQGDSINGDSGNDFVFGFGGDDTISGNDNNDTIGGGDGNDNLNGNAGNDIVSGGVGDDSVVGDTGNDTLGGDAGNDTISAGLGADSINGGTGNDLLSAGLDTDKDVFYFNINSGNDVITQFDVANDLVQITSDVFANVSAVLATLINDVNGNAVLSHGADWSITFVGVSSAQLQMSDFTII